MKVFTKSFTQQEPIPDKGIERAVELMRSGRLHRYNVDEGEVSEVSMLESEYASYQGSQYCLACASGGYAIHIALRSAGIQAGDLILTNAYTLAPVPGAIHNAGGIPILVEIDQHYHINLDDLRVKAEESGAKFLLLSHMRGHISDMNTVVELCEEFGITLIEDCAHTMGARWRGIRSGNFGTIACFSTQTYKHMNSGEGGLLTTNDPEIMARAVIYSGSYMLYGLHGTIPEEAVFEQIRLTTPNFSGRMDNLRAGILRAQLPLLDSNCQRWNRRYQILAHGLKHIQGINVPVREEYEAFVGSSIQFTISTLSKEDFPEFIARCRQRGVVIKWFGADEPDGFTSRYDSWRYLDNIPDLPQTLTVLSTTCDMRIPLTFTESDCHLIVEIIDEVLQEK